MDAAQVFDEHRPLLFGIAYRMLGSVMDAEDVVQDAFLRWQATDVSTVESPRAFLCTIVTRLSIDRLRSAQKRREVYVGEWLPEPIMTENDPRVAADVADSLSTAFLILLESLSPPERAAFLLREVFGYEYPAIAEVIGKSEDNCRQIVKRARDRLADRRPRFETSPDIQSRLVMQFIEATETGDLDRLVATLADDAALYTDHGGKVVAARRPLHGADKIARFAIGLNQRFRPENFEMRVVSLNGRPGLVTYANGVPDSAVTIHCEGDRIVRLYAIRNPDKLAHLVPPKPN